MLKPLVLHQTDGRKAAFNPDHVAMVTPTTDGLTHEQAGVRGSCVFINGYGGVFVTETYEQVMELWLDRIAAGR